MAGEERDPQVIEAIRQKLHLGDPLIVQYFTWLGGCADWRSWSFAANGPASADLDRVETAGDSRIGEFSRL